MSDVSCVSSTAAAGRRKISSFGRVRYHHTRERLFGHETRSTLPTPADRLWYRPSPHLYLPVACYWFVYEHWIQHTSRTAEKKNFSSVTDCNVWSVGWLFNQYNLSWCAEMKFMNRNFFSDQLRTYILVCSFAPMHDAFQVSIGFQYYFPFSSRS